MPEPRLITPPARSQPPPTNKQVYALGRAAFELAGLPWPGTRAEASAMITRLRAQIASAGQATPASQAET
jgi:hypothetical protein